MIDLKVLIEPLMGTLIGFGTNFLAVKMLFRPYKEVKIGKFVLPFTPGVIPKRKDKLAQAFGQTISNEFFTNKDIQNIFLAENVKNVVREKVLNDFLNDKETIRSLLVKNISEEKYDMVKNKIEKKLVEKIIKGLLEINVGNIIAQEGSAVIKEKLSGSFFGNFISDEKISMLALGTGDKIEVYIKEHGEEVLLPYIDNEVSNSENQIIIEFLKNHEISEDKIKQIIEDLYIKIISEKLENIFDSFNISEVIENKINDMDVKDIENLFMAVMKKELNAIVNLGAVLGFLLGCINIFL